jgi:threonine aldolase
MCNKILDFRSDTVTRPTPGMYAAMADAELGDDVFGDDPTVIRLQKAVAERMGKEAALFVPSGTMSNLIAVRSHCRPGDELICEEGCHIYNYEQGGYAQICGVSARPVKGISGVMRVEQLDGLVRRDNVHFVRTRLLTIENTHNLGGGKIQPFEVVEDICRWAKQNGLKTHLDGARIMNAAAATGIEPARWARQFDTVSVCFSKGLGAPAGSALCGQWDLIAAAVRHRKVLGGGMRQSGILAAAALYALEHHVDRLAEDHANARRLAEGIRKIDHLQFASDEIDTNMLFFRIDPAWGTAGEFIEKIKAQGVWMLASAPATIRAVTHLDISEADVDRAIEIIASTMKSKS